MTGQLISVTPTRPCDPIRNNFLTEIFVAIYCAILKFAHGLLGAENDTTVPFSIFGFI